MGTPGPTYADEEGGTRSYQESLKDLKRTKLFFFEKYFDGWTQRRIVKESNAYIDELKTKSRPATYPARFSWPPKWVQTVPEWTISRLFRWIALLLWLGMQKTANEEEVWSTHWLWERPGVKKFFTYKEHKAMKASLHCQNEQETKRDDPDGRPMIRKCGFLMQRM